MIAVLTIAIWAIVTLVSYVAFFQFTTRKLGGPDIRCAFTGRHRPFELNGEKSTYCQRCIRSIE